MTEVSIHINGRDYAVACEDGEEEHLLRLGRYIDKRVKDLARQVGQIGEAPLLVMTALVVADELSEANDRAQAARDDGARAIALDLAARLDQAAGAVEGVAERLERG